MFAIPETAPLFQQNSNMATVACMSQRIINEIKSHCEGKDAILYTDSTSDWDIHLSVVIILCLNPSDFKCQYLETPLIYLI